MKNYQENAVKFLSPILFGFFYYLYPAQFVDNSLLDTLFFTFGGLLGQGLLFADEKYFFERYQEQGVEKNVLITRSVLFMGVLVPLGIYLLTSTGSSLGIGLILGLVTGIFVEMLLNRNNVDAFNTRFLSQLKKKYVASEITSITAVFGVFWALLLVSVLVLGQAFSGNTYQLPF